MKRFILFIITATSAALLSAQTVNVHFKNGQEVQFYADNVDFVDFSIKAPEHTTSSGQVVDLGLSVYWASCNLGAEKPEEYGDYYAWGETKPKSSFSRENYSYYNSSTSLYTDIGSDINGTEYDAATVNLGKDWRMPTEAEMSELRDLCSWEWIQVNGINGYKITGPSGNSIFLPASTRSYYLDYLTSTEAAYNRCYRLIKNLESITAYYVVISDKYDGGSIRPITSNLNASSEVTDHSQDYLVTEKVTAAFNGGSYIKTNGRIQAGSQLNVSFINGSSESVLLTKIQLGDASTESVGNNMLNEEIEVAPSETKSFGVTVGIAGLLKPIIRFTYKYNKKNYVAEATWND